MPIISMFISTTHRSKHQATLLRAFYHLLGESSRLKTPGIMVEDVRTFYDMN